MGAAAKREAALARDVESSALKTPAKPAAPASPGNGRPPPGGPRRDASLRTTGRRSLPPRLPSAPAAGRWRPCPDSKAGPRRCTSGSPRSRSIRRRRPTARRSLSRRPGHGGEAVAITGCPSPAAAVVPPLASHSCPAPAASTPPRGESSAKTSMKGLPSGRIELVPFIPRRADTGEVRALRWAKVPAGRPPGRARCRRRPRPPRRRAGRARRSPT